MASAFLYIRTDDVGNVHPDEFKGECNAALFRHVAGLQLADTVFKDQWPKVEAVAVAHDWIIMNREGNDDGS